jgi:hypothetical protein
MRHEKLFAFVFFFVVTGAALVGGEWSASLIGGSKNPPTPFVIIGMFVSGIVTFIALFAASYAMGMFEAEDPESRE